MPRGSKAVTAAQAAALQITGVRVFASGRAALDVLR